MARRRQNNLYTLTHADGRETKVVANSYTEVANAIKCFKIDAVTIQREYKSSNRKGRVKTVWFFTPFWGEIFCANCLLTKPCIMCYNGRPGAHVRAEISIIPCPGQFVKQNVQKKCTNIFSQFCAGCLLKSASGFAIISMSVEDRQLGGGSGEYRPPKKSSWQI